MAGKLTTHVLDTVRGVGAGGLRISVRRLAPEVTASRMVALGDDGRALLLEGADFTAGQYEIVFFVGEYRRGTPPQSGTEPFFEDVPVRFSVGDPSRAYHVPLIMSPFGYTTYLGS